MYYWDTTTKNQDECCYDYPDSSIWFMNLIAYDSNNNKTVSDGIFLMVDNSFSSPELINIKEAYFINERRWNLKFTNQIIVLLSEKNIETSLINYIKLFEQLKESEILSIKSIDLRNKKKAIINFK